MDTLLRSVKWCFVLLSLLPSIPVKAEGIYKDGKVIIGGLLTVRHKNSDDSCGDLKPQGLAYVEAVIYAIETINKDKSLLPNVTLGYDIMDSCDSPALANSLAFDFVTRNKATKLRYEVNDTAGSFQKYFGVLRKPIAAVIGTGDSSSSVVVASMLHIDDIPQVSPFATSEELSLPYFKTFFRPVPPDGQQAKALADVVDYFKWKYVYVVGVDTSYGRYGVMALENEALERGTFCISQISYFPPSGYQKKMKTIVSKIKLAANVKVVVLWGGPTTSLHFIEEAFMQGITGRTWLAPEGWSEATPLFKDKYMQIIGGFVGTKLRNYNLDGYVRHLTSLNYSSARVQNHTWWKEYWMLQQKCKNALTCDFENFYITKQRYEDMYTAYLAYVIDAVYVIAHAVDAIYRCQESSRSDCPKTEPFIDTKEILKFMRNVTFEGVTGKVEFDKNGDSISSAAYDIVNLHDGDAAPQLRIIGNWDRGKESRLNINNNSLFWNNGSNEVPVSVCMEPCPPGYMQTVTVACCWKCIRCPIGFISQSYSSSNCTECPIDKMPDPNRTECIDLPEVNVSFRDSQAIALVVVAGIEFILVLFVLAIGFKYRNTPIVKSSNREMSVLFLFGIIIGIVSGVILLARPTPLMCYLDNPLHALYYTLCLSILVVKTNRLVRVFEFTFVSSRISQLCNGKNAQFVILFFLNGIAIVLVTLWHVLDPPYVHVTIERLKSKHLGCREHKETLGLALQGSLYAYQLGLSVFCAYYAFKARNLPANFSEARYIAFAMYMQLLCSICYATLQNSVEGNFLTTFSSAIIIISSFGFLVCMFAPKVYIILKFPEKNTAEYVKASVANHSLQRGFSQVNVKPDKKFKTTAAKLKSQRETINSSLSTMSTTDGVKDDSKKMKSVSFQNIIEEVIETSKKPNGVAKGTEICNGNSNPKEAFSRQLNGKEAIEIVEPCKNFDGVAKESEVNECNYIPSRVSKEQKKADEYFASKIHDTVVKEQRTPAVCEANSSEQQEINIWQLNTNAVCPSIPKRAVSKRNEYQNGCIVIDRPPILELETSDREDYETRL